MTSPLSRARLLFEDFTGPDAAKILLSLPQKSPRLPEDEWFDCKAGTLPPDSMAKAWSKAVGAFANNEGGVVVWGLRAERDSLSGIDAVSGLDLVSDVFQFKTRLAELQRKANDPPVAGVEIVAVAINSGSPEGFVVCLVPESSFKPHRSELASQRFYIRVGDSSEPCSVSLLRQLFFPRSTARLQIELQRVSRQLSRLYQLKSSAEGSNDVRACFQLGIRNIGVTSVADIFVRIENGSNFVLELTDEKSEIPSLKLYAPKSLPSVRFLARNIHPGLSYRIDLVVLRADDKWHEPWVFTVYGRDLQPLKATIAVGEGSRDEPTVVPLEST